MPSAAGDRKRAVTTEPDAGKVRDPETTVASTPGWTRTALTVRVTSPESGRLCGSTRTERRGAACPAVAVPVPTLPAVATPVPALPNEIFPASTFPASTFRVTAAPSSSATGRRASTCTRPIDSRAVPSLVWERTRARTRSPVEAFRDGYCAVCVEAAVCEELICAGKLEPVRTCPEATCARTVSGVAGRPSASTTMESRGVLVPPASTFNARTRVPRSSGVGRQAVTSDCPGANRAVPFAPSPAR